MPEGDTLYRTATVLRQTLTGGRVTDARGRAGGAQLSRVIDSEVVSVRATGKHLLIEFRNGLTLHTHLQMNGSWHRYHRGERWRLDPDRAVAVLETSTAIAVCFDAPTVELLDSRALSVHPVLAGLGPDLLAADWDVDESCARLLAPARPGTTVAEALLDQRIVAGIGNVYRSEILFTERFDPFVPVEGLSRANAERLFRTARRLLQANVDGGHRVTMPDALGAPPGASATARRDARRWVYGRAGRPCRRCGSIIRARSIGALPRRLFWCPLCQVSSVDA
jgi:endonuclease VIII